MEIENIEGGVSPLKAKRQASRGGKHAGKATKTGRRRGGFAKSKGKRGAGGRNVGGYNVQTRFRPRAVNPTFGATGGVSESSKPYSYDKDGKLQVNKPNQDQSQSQSQTQGREWVPPVYGTRNKSLPSYKEAWEDESRWTIEDGKKIDKYGNVYSTFEEFEAAAKKWNAENKGKGGASTETYLIQEGYWRPTGGTQTQTQTQTQSQ